MARKLIIALIALIVVAAIALAILYRVQVHPWLAMPEEPRETIDARWAKVVNWSGVAELSPQQPRLLLEAAALIDEAASADPDLFDRLAGHPGARLADSELSEEARQALARLEQWHRDGPALGSELCNQAVDLSALTMLSLARLALARAGGQTDDAQVAAVLHLGESLRDTGGMLHFAVGATLFDLAVERALERRIPPGPAFAKHRMEVSEVFPALAREYVCTYRHVERVGAEQTGLELQPWWLHRLLDQLLGGELERKAARYGSWDRELLVYRQFFGRWLETLHPYAGDLAALAQRADFSDSEQLPMSMLVQVSAISLSGQVEHFAAKLKRYDQLLASDFPEPAAEPEASDQPTAEAVEAAAAEPAVTLEHIERGPTGDLRIKRGELKQALSRLDQLAMDCRIIPAFEQGKPVGFKLFGITPGSIYEQVGFESGDIVTAVDGIALVSPDAALEAFSHISERDRVTIELRRGDQRHELRYTLVD